MGSLAAAATPRDLKASSPHVSRNTRPSFSRFLRGVNPEGGESTAPSEDVFLEGVAGWRLQGRVQRFGVEVALAHHGWADFLQSGQAIK